MSEVTKRGGAVRVDPVPDTRCRYRGEKGREQDGVNTKSGDGGEGVGAVSTTHYPIAVVTEVVDSGTKQFANCQGATRLQTSQSSGG